ncbi:MAG TPA: hypothetical protein VNL77_06850 [Roseiflexaceae bacterium]|nr:hypothetical protein [Roseiflexaceae bacterium]
MIETIPGLLLAGTIALTLILLPHLNEERRGERTGTTEELHIRRDVEHPKVQR